MESNILNFRERKNELIDTYRAFPKIGIFAGAGVTAASNVKTYQKLALRLLEKAYQDRPYKEELNWVPVLIDKQRSLIDAKDKQTIPPDEIVLFVKNNLADSNNLFLKLFQNVLYEEAPVEKTVFAEVYEENITLNALITFCAARANSILAPSIKTQKNKTSGEEKNDKVELNTKIGGILTTNYDNLIEGAFHRKYRIKNGLIPIGRPGSQEDFSGKTKIPVYHNHGYIHYLKRKNDGNYLNYPSVIISEDDYYSRFYDTLGFGNYISMNFFRRYPCLFIGSGMTDKNIRRYLYHLKRDCTKPGKHQKKYAILNVKECISPEFTDNILGYYGVETLWIKDFSEIEEILKEMYISIPGIEEKDWDYLKQYDWKELDKKKALSRPRNKNQPEK